MNVRITKEGKVKLFFSLALLAYALIFLCICISKRVYTGFYAFFAMFFSTMGDIKIMENRGVFKEKKGGKTFIWGIFYFAYAHVLYLTCMSKSIIILLITLVLFTLVIVFTQKKNQKLASVFYAMILLLNAGNAWTFSILAGIGGLLFVTSDLILTICEEKSPKWQWAIWLTYVPAQACLLTAVLINNI